MFFMTSEFKGTMSKYECRTIYYDVRDCLERCVRHYYDIEYFKEEQKLRFNMLASLADTLRFKNEHDSFLKRIEYLIEENKIIKEKEKIIKEKENNNICGTEASYD